VAYILRISATCIRSEQIVLQLVDASSDSIVACGSQTGYGLALDEIASHLRMSSECDEIGVEAGRLRYQAYRNIATHTDTYEELTRRVLVQYDDSFCNVRDVQVDQSSQSYPPTHEGALATARQGARGVDRSKVGRPLPNKSVGDLGSPSDLKVAVKNRPKPALPANFPVFVQVRALGQ
jgi:hypothetical protein